MQVLIADDDQNSLQLLQIMLSKEGFEVITAKNGKEAIEIINRKDSPHLLVLDWMMPEVDGLGVCRYVREQADERYRYIVLLTARSQKEDIVVGMQAGADDYIVKPFNAAELKVRLQAGKRVLDLHKRLLERSQTVQDFVYTVSHDMRTPLIAMNMTMSQALEGAFGAFSERYNGILHKTKRSVIELLSMTDTLLMMARCDEGDFREREIFSPVDLYTLALDCAADVEPIIKDKNIHLLVQNPHRICTIDGAENSLRRVYINLIENASKFTPAGGKINIDFSINEDSVWVRVSDSGQGVPDDHVQNLFTRFALSSSKRRGSGTGLGLYVCRRIIEEHGGEISYSPQPEGTGSIFTFRLPLLK